MAELMQYAKDSAVDGVVGLLGIGTYSKVIKAPLSGVLGSFLGKYAGAGSSYVAALGARYVGEKVGHSEYGRVAAGAIFGQGLAVLFGVADPGYSMVSGANRPAAVKPFQGLSPVALTPQVS